jgi:hypothetical protein
VNLRTGQTSLRTSFLFVQSKAESDNVIVVTGSALLTPPEGVIMNQQLAWQRATPFLSFPERDGTGDYTLGYPFPASLKIIYNGAWEALVNIYSQSSIYANYESKGLIVERRREELWTTFLGTSADKTLHVQPRNRHPPRPSHPVLHLHRLRLLQLLAQA